VNRSKVSWEEFELKSILFTKGLWDEVVTVDNQKLKNSDIEVISAKEGVADLEEEEEEIEKIIEEECYDVHEEYKEDSWRGKS